MAIFIFSLASSSGRAQPPLQKIDPWLLEQKPTLQAVGEPVEFIVVLAEQADLKGVAAFGSNEEKGGYIFDRLVAVARQAQAPLLKRLKALGVEARPYWIANMIWVKASWEVLEEIALRPDVAFIVGNPSVSVDLPTPENSLPSPMNVDAIEWNIVKIGADQVWDAGFTGQGVVVGGQDTGYEWTHSALIDSYRGWDGASADHSYSWHDAIHVANAACPADSPEPCDDHGHGTHTMGIMVGDDGGTNQIGVAPGAQWIGCRNMNNGVGTPASYTECFEWFLAPYPQGGDPLDGDPSLAPDVINNSWGCPASEGCTLELINILRDIVDTVRAAGILVVASAGNYGPSCSTTLDPIGIYENVFSVGNTDSTDLIASTSSRGPVMIDGSGRMKPDISAPGTNIRSSYLNSAYVQMSGTSMAAPHVAGTAALLMSAEPFYKLHPEVVELILQNSAVPIITSQTCGGIPGDQVPNNTYGWGRLNAFAAFQQIPTFLHLYLPIIIK